MDSRAVLAAYDEQIRRRPAPDLPGGWVERDQGVVRCISGPDAWNGVTWSALEDADVDAVIAAQIDRFLFVSNRPRIHFNPQQARGFGQLHEGPRRTFMEKTTFREYVIAE